MSSNVLAQSFWDDETLDKWEIPLGLWTEEIVFWLTNNRVVGALLDAVKWPVDQLLALVIDNILQDWLPWPLVLLLFVVVGTATRNFLVGLGSAAGLLVCGLLGEWSGETAWYLTTETLGMIVVAVFLCTIMGIPLGIVAARIDSFWNRLRPILDGMQVVHPFVYILPVVFLFGVRRTPGVLCTLVFALPPIVRLTNLGIRQVPSEVVEAARGFGATETRVLREVQLPLARPAIMAGLNQTLLMSLSMVGIVAIIAGGGWGEPILEAVAQANIPEGAAAGAALYLVGVLLDRISQPEETVDRRNLFARMRSAWSTRLDPVVPPVPGTVEERRALDLATLPAAPKLTPSYRLGAIAALCGGLAAAGSTLLAWGHDASLLSSWARFDDVDLPGPHSGLDATGGSWFGILFGLFGLAAAMGGGSAIWRPSSRDRFFAGGGAFLAAGIVMVSLVVAYLTVAARGDNYSHGAGAGLALLGAVVVFCGGAYAAIRSRFDGGATGSEPPKVGPREVIGIVVLALFLGFAGASGSWILDQRSDAAQIAAELAAEAGGGVEQGGLATEILTEAMAQTRRVTTRGLDAGGPQIGYIVLVLTVAATLAALGRILRNRITQPLLGLAVLGLGCAITAIGFAWIATFVRLSTPQLTPGASAFVTTAAGLILAARGWKASRLA